MGASCRHICFDGEMPGIESVFEGLTHIMEGAVTCKKGDEDVWLIECTASEEMVGLSAEAQEWSMFFTLGNHYLVDAVTVVLQELGGTFEHPLPPEARQPWRIAEGYYRNYPVPFIYSPGKRKDRQP